MLTDEQKEVVRLSKEVELKIEELKQLNSKLDEALTVVGLGSSFQDPTDNIVFEIVIPKGQFTSFRHIGYERTKRSEERAGSLSVKRAKELGFNV